VDSETVDNLLNKIAAVLEEHTVILVNHRQNLEHLFKEVAQVKTRLEKLETSDSDKSDDANLIAEMTARLKAILDSLRAKD
jgi:ABC-type uncharacterized transport system fused permease/ATPase subunit